MNFDKFIMLLCMLLVIMLSAPCVYYVYNNILARIQFEQLWTSRFPNRQSNYIDIVVACIFLAIGIIVVLLGILYMLYYIIEPKQPIRRLFIKEKQ